MFSVQNLVPVVALIAKFIPFATVTCPPRLIVPVKEVAPEVVIGYAVPAARSHRLESTVQRSVVATGWTIGVEL